jgi:hypothetical protein
VRLVEIKVLGSNCSEDTLLLYNFTGRVEAATVSESRLCDGGGSASFEKSFEKAEWF